jgi:hypothetical protein
MTPVDDTLDRRAKRKYFQIMNLTAREPFSRKLTGDHIVVVTGRVR